MSRSKTWTIVGYQKAKVQRALEEAKVHAKVGGHLSERRDEIEVCVHSESETTAETDVAFAKGFITGFLVSH